MTASEAFEPVIVEQEAQRAESDVTGQHQVVALSQLTIPEGRLRPVDLEGLDGLVESIRVSGVIEPPVVDQALCVIAGARRVNAARKAGLKAISVIVRNVDDVHRQLIEIDENLCRDELSHLQRARHLARRKALYEALHPESRRGGAPGVAGGGKEACPASGFVDDVAAKTGRGRSTLFEDCRIGAMPTDVLDALVGSAVEDKKGELLLLAKQEEEAQRAVATALSNGQARSVRHALEQLEDDDEGDDEEEDSRAPASGAVTPAILENADTIESVLHHAESALAQAIELRDAWTSEPGPDVIPVLSYVNRACASLAEVQKAFEWHVTPENVCGDCDGLGVGCETCAGKGWLSKTESESMKPVEEGVGDARANAPEEDPDDRGVGRVVVMPLNCAEAPATHGGRS